MLDFFRRVDRWVETASPSLLVVLCFSFVFAMVIIAAIIGVALR